MTDHKDLMLSELDRQLEELRQQVDALGSRSGVLLSASAVSVTVLGNTLVSLSGWTKLALIAFGVAVGVGVWALWPTRFDVGPYEGQIRKWLGEPTETGWCHLFDEKSKMVKRNSKRLGTRNSLVISQCFAVAAAVILAIVAIWTQ